MKRWQLAATVLLFLSLYLGVGASPGWSQGRGQGFRPCPYTPYVCPVTATCQPFLESGKVVKVLTEALTTIMHPGLALVMETKTKGQVLVHLGPAWYLERQVFELNRGDEVQVKGVCEKEKDGKLGVIAYELSKGDYILHLRDSQGRPYWEAWRKK